MNEKRAREILGNVEGRTGAIHPDGRLYNLGAYLDWAPGYENATLDGEFTADQLEAIAWWMRNAASLKGGQ